MLQNKLREIARYDRTTLSWKCAPESVVFCFFFLNESFRPSLNSWIILSPLRSMSISRYAITKLLFSYFMNSDQLYHINLYFLQNFLGRNPDSMGNVTTNPSIRNLFQECAFHEISAWNLLFRSSNWTIVRNSRSMRLNFKYVVQNCIGYPDCFYLFLFILAQCRSS